MIEAAFADVAERHHLDERKLHAAPVRPLQQGWKFVLVHAFERHRVDLDLQSSCLRGIDPGQDLVQLTPARDGAELVGIERVERDVDAFDAAARELARIFRQLRTVGGERELVERSAREMAGERGDEGHYAAPHQRLAASEPELPDAARDKGAAQPIEFFKREQVGLGQERHVLRHAIDAAKIAAVRHRHAQIGDRPPEGVDQRSVGFSLTLKGEIVLHHDRRRHGSCAASAFGSLRIGLPSARRSALSYGNSDGYRPERLACRQATVVSPFHRN